MMLSGNLSFNLLTDYMILRFFDLRYFRFIKKEVNKVDLFENFFIF